MPENCLYDCRLRDTCIYVPRWADEETLLRIGTERSKSCPLVQVYEVPKETEQAHTVMLDRKIEPTISKMEQVDEPQADCYMCKWLGEVDVCGRCRNRNLFAEAEPQPRCPKCGKRGYIRSLESMGVKLKVFDEYRWKCTNCNKYFKEEPKDEPQTDCHWK